MQKLHDKLMKKAYDTWQKNNWSPSEFIENIDSPEKFAVILGNLNYQVENGGFSQWKFNGYSKNHIFFIRMLLDDTNWGVTSEHPQLREGLELAIKAERIQIEDNSEDYVDDEQLELNYNRLDKLDDKYYSLTNIENEMNEYLKELQKFNN